MEPNQSLSRLEQRALEALSSRSSVAAKILDAWSSGQRESAHSVRDLVNIASLGVTEEAAAREILERLTDLGLASRRAGGFQISIGQRDSMKRLALALQAISYYHTAIHQDQSTARVVLTRPPQLSDLEQRLANRGWRTAELETTRDAFLELVARASKRVVVMTPFLDTRGAEWLCELFGRVRDGVDRILVLRTLESPGRPDYPMGYTKGAKRWHEAGVRVFNYSISHVGSASRETFHAKVVLCDEDSAYVGSANLTAASLDHSMELGIALSGRAASQVAIVVDAVLDCAKPWPYTD